ncbi:hypothetical protein IWZ01DRAFT_570898, partial [Phyllosticta capitalensis]
SVESCLPPRLDRPVLNGKALGKPADKQDALYPSMPNHTSEVRQRRDPSLLFGFSGVSFRLTCHLPTSISHHLPSTSPPVSADQQGKIDTMFPHQQRYANKRPSIGTSATVGGGGSNSGRRKSSASSSLPPSPWSPGTRYEPFFGEAALVSERTRGGIHVGSAGGASGVGEGREQEKLDEPEEEQDLATVNPFKGFVRRVSRIGMPGWKMGYSRVGGREQDEEEGRFDQSAGVGGGSGGNTMTPMSVGEHERSRPWWRSAAAAVTAVNVVLFCVTLFVCLRHGTGGKKALPSIHY